MRFIMTGIGTYLLYLCSVSQAYYSMLQEHTSFVFAQRLSLFPYGKEFVRDIANP